MKILVGADPEMFIHNPNSGQFVSAHDLIPGTKYLPQPVKHGAVQHDGVAAEFNIDPAGTADEFVRNINSVRSTLQSLVPGYNLLPEPTATFEPAYFKSIPDEAKELGCDPDFNAWTYDQNPQPTPGESSTMRTGAGHIHIGWTTDAEVYDGKHFMKCAEMAQQMDYYLGIWSLLWDKDNTRRSLYGKAGAFRPKPYGMEYRVLSNSWLSSPILTRWVYNSAVQGANNFFMGAKETDFHREAAKEIINNNEVDWLSRYDDMQINVPPLPVQYLKRVG